MTYVLSAIVGALLAAIALIWRTRESGMRKQQQADLEAANAAGKTAAAAAQAAYNLEVTRNDVSAQIDATLSTQSLSDTLNEYNRKAGSGG